MFHEEARDRNAPADRHRRCSAGTDASLRGRCAGESAALLRFHYNDEPSQPIDVEKNVKVLPPIEALKGNGRFDVLEVWGHIYKASYRMRFIYARIRGSCVLMGQEILEASDPY
jgi:hypothetical protein